MPSEQKESSDRSSYSLRQVSVPVNQGSTSDSFNEYLKEYLVQLTELHQRGASEASIRDLFLQFLRRAFPHLASSDPILLEKHIPALRVRGGFADALYGDLIFEFKRRLDDASRQQGHEELRRYLLNQEHPDRYFGLLTDGITLEVLVVRDGILQRVDSLTFTAERADETKRWLDCYLFHEKNIVPTANDVALRFGERSPTFLHSVRVLSNIWSNVNTQPTAQTKFIEWQGLLSIVYGSGVGDQSLFLRHTYLALFARALAFAVIERRAPSPDEVSGIITGEVFQRLGFENFVGDDFFTWMIDPSVSEQAQGMLQSIATRLTAAYDLRAIREDLLKELYQELVDPETRHDLGEFYTPDWLAELTLRKAGFPSLPQSLEEADSNRESVPSLFDPSCGSGTFLFTAVRLLREAGLRGQQLVKFCVQNLAGIDVHPLAVTIAKTNVLLALGEDLRGYEDRVSLPIFLADTLSPGRPRFQARPESDVISISVDVETIAARTGKKKPRNLYPMFEIPLSLAEQPDLLHKCVEALLELGEPRNEEKHAFDGMRRRIKDLGVPECQWHRWISNLKLIRWLLEPPVTNSVWRFVLNNAYQPELLARRKFAYVVGNPPWLAYRYMQPADYQQRVRELVFDYGLLQPKQANLFTQMEMATLFFAFCADRFLLDGGKIAFVMPRSVITGAKQHAEFRNRYLAAADFIIDCEQVVPLFNVPACVIIYRHSTAGADQALARAGIPTLRLQGRLPSRNASLSEAKLHWNETETTFSMPVPKIGSPYLSDIVEGATIVPRCLWFVEPPKSARVVDRHRPQLETDSQTQRQAKKPWKGIRLTGSVEADFLFATLLSDNMLPFGWRQFSLVVLPIAENNDSSLHIVDIDEAVCRGKTGLADWLRKATEVWSKNRKSPNDLLDWINWRNKLIRQRPKGILKLLYNAAGTHVCSCVVDATDTSAWKVRGLPVRGFISDSVTYWLETQDMNEAHYLSAVLNAPVVDHRIKPYQTKGAFGAQTGGGYRHIHRRPFELLPIPRFDPKAKRHLQLAELSQYCHEKVAAAVTDARDNGDERFFTIPIGRLRTKLRKELLDDELSQIDRLVRQILKISER